MLVDHGLGVKKKLLRLAVAMRELLEDDEFLELLRAEKLDQMPTQLFSRTQLLSVPLKALRR